MNFDETNSQLPEKFKHITLKPNPVALAPTEIRQYLSQTQAPRADAVPSGSWLLKPELPSSQEIFGTDDEYLDLGTNQIQGAWESKEAYLKAHYELLREDAVAPLRDAVAIFRADPDMDDDKDVFVYEKVRALL